MDSPERQPAISNTTPQGSPLRGSFPPSPFNKIFDALSPIRPSKTFHSQVYQDLAALTQSPPPIFFSPLKTRPRIRRLCQEGAEQSGGDGYPQTPPQAQTGRLLLGDREANAIHQGGNAVPAQGIDHSAEPEHQRLQTGNGGPDKSGKRRVDSTGNQNASEESGGGLPPGQFPAQAELRIELFQKVVSKDGGSELIVTSLAKHVKLEQGLATASASVGPLSIIHGDPSMDRLDGDGGGKVKAKVTLVGEGNQGSHREGLTSMASEAAPSGSFHHETWQGKAVKKGSKRRQQNSRHRSASLRQRTAEPDSGDHSTSKYPHSASAEPDSSALDGHITGNSSAFQEGASAATETDFAAATQTAAFVCRSSDVVGSARNDEVTVAVTTHGAGGNWLSHYVTQAANDSSGRGGVTVSELQGHGTLCSHTIKRRLAGCTEANEDIDVVEEETEAAAEPLDWIRSSPLKPMRGVCKEGAARKGALALTLALEGLPHDMGTMVEKACEKEEANRRFEECTGCDSQDRKTCSEDCPSQSDNLLQGYEEVSTPRSKKHRLNLNNGTFQLGSQLVLSYEEDDMHQSGEPNQPGVALSFCTSLKLLHSGAPNLHKTVAAREAASSGQLQKEPSRTLPSPRTGFGLHLNSLRGVKMSQRPSGSWEQLKSRKGPSGSMVLITPSVPGEKLKSPKQELSSYQAVEAQLQCHVVSSSASALPLVTHPEASTANQNTAPESIAGSASMPVSPIRQGQGTLVITTDTTCGSKVPTLRFTEDGAAMLVDKADGDGLTNRMNQAAGGPPSTHEPSSPPDPPGKKENSTSSSTAISGAVTYRLATTLEQRQAMGDFIKSSSPSVRHLAELPHGSGRLIAHGWEGPLPDGTYPPFPVGHGVKRLSGEYAMCEVELSESEESSRSSNGRRKSDGGGCKRCSCKKSRCLKLYCECFRSGLYCTGSCRCEDCLNTSEFEALVLETRALIEARNPMAFKPRIVQAPELISSGTVDESQDPSQGARHKSGCNCKKSFCTKKYCECFQAGVGCMEGCRCENCANPYGTNGGVLGDDRLEDDDIGGFSARPDADDGMAMVLRDSADTGAAEGQLGQSGAGQWQLFKGHHEERYPKPAHNLSPTTPFQLSGSTPRSLAKGRALSKRLSLDSAGTVVSHYAPMSPQRQGPTAAPPSKLPSLSPGATLMGGSDAINTSPLTTPGILTPMPQAPGRPSHGSAIPGYGTGSGPLFAPADRTSKQSKGWEASHSAGNARRNSGVGAALPSNLATALNLSSVTTTPAIFRQPAARSPASLMNPRAKLPGRMADPGQAAEPAGTPSHRAGTPGQAPTLAALKFPSPHCPPQELSSLPKQASVEAQEELERREAISGHRIKNVVEGSIVSCQLYFNGESCDAGPVARAVATGKLEVERDDERVGAACSGSQLDSELLPESARHGEFFASSHEDICCDIIDPCDDLEGGWDMPPPVSADGRSPARKRVCLSQSQQDAAYEGQNNSPEGPGGSQGMGRARSRSASPMDTSKKLKIFVPVQVNVVGSSDE